MGSVLPNAYESERLHWLGFLLIHRASRELFIELYGNDAFWRNVHIARLLSAKILITYALAACYFLQKVSMIKESVS